MGSLLSFEDPQYTKDELIANLKQYIDIHNQLLLLIKQKKDLDFEYKFALFNINEVIAEINTLHNKIWNVKHRERDIFYMIQKILFNFEPHTTEQFIKLNNAFQNYRDVHSHIPVVPYEYIDHVHTLTFIKMSEEYIQFYETL